MDTAGSSRLLLHSNRSAPRRNPGPNPSFAEVREQLNQKVEKSPENADSLSELAVVDALLDNKEAAFGG